MKKRPNRTCVLQRPIKPIQIVYATETLQEFYSTQDIARILQLDRRTILNYLKKGYIESYSIPGKSGYSVHRVSQEQFDKFRDEWDYMPRKKDIERRRYLEMAQQVFNIVAEQVNNFDDNAVNILNEAIERMNQVRKNKVHGTDKRFREAPKEETGTEAQAHDCACSGHLDGCPTQEG